MNPKLRVTWLCLEWPRQGQHVGGVGRYVQRLASGIAPLVDLTVVSLSDPEEVPGVDFRTVPSSGGRMDRYYGAAWRARGAVRQTEPDLIHAHGDDWMLRGGVPVIRSFYGSSWNEARSSKGLRRANHAVLAGTEGISALRAQLRLGIGPEASEMFRCHDLTPPFVARSDRVVRSPAPVPTAVFVGSFEGRKQGWLAQRAVAELRSSSDSDCRLLVVGPAGDRDNWEPWVEHHAGLVDSEVWQLFSEAWVVLSPSTYEGFGIPVVEGLEAGLRVAALQNHGSRYVHDQGSDELPLSLAANNDDFIGVVARAIEDGPALTRSQALAAAELVEQFSSQGSAERILSFYEATLNQRS